MRPAGTISTFVLRLQPLRLLLITVAGWVHREQAATIGYLVEESRILNDQLRGRRLRLTYDRSCRTARRSSPSGPGPSQADVRPRRISTGMRRTMPSHNGERRADAYSGSQPGRVRPNAAGSKSRACSAIAIELGGMLSNSAYFSIRGLNLSTPWGLSAL